MKVGEDKIRLALEEIRKNIKQLVEETSRKYQLNQELLYKYGESSNILVDYNLKNQKLNHLQEKELIEKIKDLNDLGEAPSIQKLRVLAYGILKKNGDFSSLGKSWHSTFLARQANLFKVDKGKVKTKV
ncbi:uncharacterized protein KGF55_004354 [Candida pseudojiufengensis]|uniref:uncharacterized protein n=1 Tax=Candida pseudojiufengensis TaxID=497109 RepID=UPI00222487F3|nr:uncharacterized protein KGF55_004354 [Candida pseudojiufengensis]KAI5960784.1 hypothetical protein KGF55_004354 [Candida pseudojiufengensis]